MKFFMMIDKTLNSCYQQYAGYSPNGPEIMKSLCPKTVVDEQSFSHLRLPFSYSYDLMGLSLIAKKGRDCFSYHHRSAPYKLLTIFGANTMLVHSTHRKLSYRINFYFLCKSCVDGSFNFFISKSFILLAGLNI